MTDVSAGFLPPGWCPCRWTPTWRLHTNLYKFGENVSPHIFHKKNCCDLSLCEILCIFTFFQFPDSGLYPSNGFDFLLWSILNGVTLKASSNLGCYIITGVPNSRFEESIKYLWFIYAYRVRRDCFMCAVLCYTLDRWALDLQGIVRNLK